MTGTNPARNVINAQIRTVRASIRKTEISLKMATEWLIGDLQHTLNALVASDGSGRLSLDEKGIVRGKGSNIDNINRELYSYQQELAHLIDMKKKIASQ
jgi:hypothetical protein